MGGVESLNYLGFNRMIICLFFFVLGISLKKLFNDAVLLKPISKGFEFSLLILAAVVTYLLAVKINGKVALYSYVLQNYWIFVIAAIFGSTTVVIACRLFLNQKNILCVLSRYSVLILGLQYFIIDPFREKMRNIGMARTIGYDIQMVGVVTIVIIVVPIVYSVLRKWIPILKLMNGEND